MQLTILTEQYPFFIIGGIDDFMIAQFKETKE